MPRKQYNSEIKEVDEKGRVLVAANAFGNVDADNDMSLPGSYTKTIKENFNRLKWFLNHNKEILLGVPIEAKQSERHLEVLGQLNMKKEVSRDTYEDYKLYAEHGRTLEHSVAVFPVKFKMKGDVREVSEWKWSEYSTLTSWGANEDTAMLDIKSAKEYAEAIEWLEIKLRKGNFTDNKFREIEIQLQKLRSLCTEPAEATHDAEPDYQGTIKHFIQTLN